jgi:hypothetical protein
VKAYEVDIVLAKDAMEANDWAASAMAPFDEFVMKSQKGMTLLSTPKRQLTLVVTGQKGKGDM